jgi:PAS domain S-box-containing protein
MDSALVHSALVVPFLAQGVSGLFLVLVCCTLYAYRRRPYFLTWTLAWLCFSLWRLSSGFFLGGLPVPGAALDLRAAPRALALVFGSWHVALWLLGLWQFRAAMANPAASGPGWRRTAGLLAGLALMVLVLRELLPSPTRAALLHGSMALAYGGSAVWLVRSGRWRRVGPALLVAVLTLYALTRLSSVILLPRIDAGSEAPAAFPYVLFADFLLQTLTAVAMIVVLLDEERRTLHDLLRRLGESEDRFRLIFEHGDVGMALLSAEGRFVQVNPALEAMLGYPAADLEGHRLTEVYHPREIDSDYGFVRQGLAEIGPTYEREKRLMHKDGHVVWARVLRVPVLGPTGQVRYVAAVIVDVTERKRAEETLREERDFSSQVLQTADALIVVLDPDGRVLRFNHKCEEVSGYREEEVRGRHLWERLLPEETVEEARAAFARLGASDPAGTQAVESPWRTRSGAERLIAWRNTVVRDDGGTLRHVIRIGLDLTDQRRLEEQAALARKMETLGTLVGGIAHDFNNQLTAILGNLGLVLDDLRRLAGDESGAAEGPAESMEASSLRALRSALHTLLPALSDAERAGQRCAEMTARLLTFSRGRIGPTRPLPAGPFLAEAARLLRHELLPTIQLEVEPAADVWPLAADPARLHQLLANLASNARDAMPQGGRVTVALANREFTAEDCVADLRARPGRFVELRFTDTGCGMTPEVQARIFEPFFTTKPVGQGLGLGLAVAFGIVKGHKGWIGVNSVPGQGTTFRIYLPAAEAEEPAPAPPAPNPRPVGNACVLVVDDEEMVRTLARAVLERWGYRVLTAASGAEALNLYRREGHAIDAVLLDYTMPGMNGLQVLRELQGLDPGVRVIFSSGYAAEGDRDELLATGARAFVPKPYRPVELVQAVRAVLDAKGSEVRSS